ncbi:unnamed protein product [Caenorhabditis auriculariae]|uniref:beta-N-acetylhexosaminidase n=1 Tax=Caenorhabditis auriculariae TaxID=2777116 RepID=A0A8S1GWW4_9PELO|nr:unnamed protein product [Caenorhabditis auriculariae]
MYAALFLVFFLPQVHSIEGFRNAYIHFDLKGAPPRPLYFKQMLSMISNLGATGVLIEWEDMFPYKGELSRILNGNAYSESEVYDILQHAQSQGLDVIPLVQTLGHLEWILKTEEYADLREDADFPMVACIGDQRASDLILEAVNQITYMHAQFSTKYVHIGADEAFQIGTCDADKRIVPVKYDNNTLGLVFDHLQNVAYNITRGYPGVKVLMWFDEFKSAPIELIKQYNLHELVAPVVWKYTANLEKDLPTEMWKNLSYSFREVWGASAFKGADGANRYWNRMKPYIVNNKEWFIQKETHSYLFEEFNSVLITGWQRYDHFASLAELFPTSITSLALNLVVAHRFHVSEEDAEEIGRILNCPLSTTLDDFLNGNDKCRFPGYQVRDAIRSFVQLKAFFDNSTWVHNRENGWLQPSQMFLSASNPYYVDAVKHSYVRTLKKLDIIIQNLRTSMNIIFYPDVVEEFITDYVQPFYDDLQRRAASVRLIDSRRSYRPRPWFAVSSS